MDVDLNERITQSREKLNELIHSNNINSQPVIRLSQELDKLIVEYLKSKAIKLKMT